MSPQISNEEPLRIECRHFVECVRTGSRAAVRAPRAACAPCGCSRRCSARSTRAAPRSGCRRPGAAREALRPPVRPGAGADARPRRRARRGRRARRLASWSTAAPRSATGCEIQDGAVLGKRPRLGQRSTAPREDARAAACSEAGARGLRGRGRLRRRAASGAGAIVGDQAQVRERVDGRRRQR